MSQKVTRKSAVTEEKDKRQTDSPVKDMKKKMAANAEKEKQLSEKNAEKEKQITEKSEKNDKSADKSEKHDKGAEKSGDKANKATENTDKADKSGEKSDKAADKNEKKSDKLDKKTEQAEKAKEDGKVEKSSKHEKQEKKNGRPSRNGVQEAANGVAEANGTEDANGTASGESDEDVMLVIDDHDEHFPELTYDDTSDVECFEPPTPDPASRSLTRRSQVKSTRTPETPRPASDKQHDSDDSKEPTKVLKMKDDPPQTDRKLRSADSPKPQDKKDTQEKRESKKDKQESREQDAEVKDGKADKTGSVEAQVTVTVDNNEGSERKPDTNYSKSRVKVSPYRRSRLPEHSDSLVANYTGNNTTMEMDITESSFMSEEAAADDSGYLRGLRTIKGRASYKQLKDLPLKHTTRRAHNVNVSVNSETSVRPTGTVVGRKRKPDVGAVPAGDSGDRGDSGDAGDSADMGDIWASSSTHSKRMRLLDRISLPFRKTIPSPLLPRRAAEIVGINTDLPLTAPVASPEPFDPERLKAEPQASGSAPAAPAASASDDRDPKRCIVM